MKDKGKRANRSALIMRRTSRAKAEDFWFILLNSLVAWKDSHFNCSWFWEALASEEVKCLQGLACTKARGPEEAFSQTSRVLCKATVSPPELGRGESAGHWPVPADCQPCPAKWRLYRPPATPMFAILESSTVRLFDLNTSCQNILVVLFPCLEDGKELRAMNAMPSWGWFDFDFFPSGPFFLDQAPSLFQTGMQKSGDNAPSHVTGASREGLNWGSSVEPPQPSLRVLTLIPAGPGPSLVLFLNTILLNWKVNNGESIQGLRVFTLVTTKAKIPVRASFMGGPSETQAAVCKVVVLFLHDWPTRSDTAWSFCVCLINCGLV